MRKAVLLVLVATVSHGCGGIAELRRSRAADLNTAADAQLLPGPSADAPSLFLRGKEALAANRFQASIVLFDSAAQAGFPRDPEWHYWLGVAHWAREDASNALAALQGALDADRARRSAWSVYALSLLGEVNGRTGRLEASRDAYRTALGREREPRQRTKIQNQLAELDLAEGTYRPDAHTLFNDRGEVIGGVGPGRMRTNRNFEIARHTSDPLREEEYYRRAIETDPGMFQPYFNLGLALVHQGRYRDAIPWLSRSDSVFANDTDLNPGRLPKADAHAFLALCNLELGDLDEAQSHLNLAFSAENTNFWAMLYAYRFRVVVGQAVLALPALTVLLDANPEHPQVLHTLSLALAELGDREVAREALQDAVAAIPEGHSWMGSLKAEWERQLDQGSPEP